jgi:tetratricopeptide (TPR) repeat protein
VSASERPDRVAQEEYVVQEPDRMVRFLRYGIFFVIVCLLCLVIYALLVGALMPPAPRTQVEAALLDAQAAVKKNPGSGQAWAQLAGAQYAGGDTRSAWNTIASARKSVSDRTILLVNTKELDFLLIEGKNAEVVKKGTEFIKLEAKYQTEALNKQAQKGITIPASLQNNAEALKLFVDKATAEGNLGQWKASIKTLDEAMLLDDTAADLLTMRGWAKLRAGDKSGAKKDFQRALQFMPNDPSATQGLNEATSTVPAKK